MAKLRPNRPVPEFRNIYRDHYGEPSILFVNGYKIGWLRLVHPAFSRAPPILTEVSIRYTAR